MEKELKRTHKKESTTHEVGKNTNLYENVLKSRPKKTNPQALEALSTRLEHIATNLNISVDELLEKAQHSVEFKEEYLEARSLACQISLLKK